MSQAAQGQTALPPGPELDALAVDAVGGCDPRPWPQMGQAVVIDKHGKAVFPVSTDPAACAALKAAVRKKGWPYRCEVMVTARREGEPKWNFVVEILVGERYADRESLVSEEHAFALAAKAAGEIDAE